MKRIQIGSKVYRIRRGELVEIPEEWVGKTLHERKSKRGGKRTRKPRFGK